MGNDRKKRVTIYDLAQELNVSPSTVSRALKDHHSIGKDTIAAVQELARRWGYRPNAIAANLRKQESNTIGVLVPWIDRPFISALISGVEEAAREAGYNVIISQSRDSFDNEVANTKALFESRIHALIVSLAMETRTIDHFEELRNSGTPLVFVDRIPDNVADNRIVIDNFDTGLAATQHLIDQGCRRIAILNGTSHQYIYRERLRGYREALTRNGLAVDESLIMEGYHLTTQEGSELAEKLFALPQPPDGIFSTNDAAAVGAIKLVKSRHIAIPQEVAIIGVNDDPVCSIIEPQLSSMSHPAKEMGRLAVRQALNADSVTGERIDPAVTLLTQVVVRASSRRVAEPLPQGTT